VSVRERCRKTPVDDGDGHVDPIDPRVETFEEVRDRVVEAAEYIAPDCLGTTDDCGFAPLADDSSTSRDIAFGARHLIPGPCL
jgi:methionine synthase II (cobalamin-independent)